MKPLAKDARRALRKLLARDALNRLRARLRWWLAGTALLWSALSLASVLADYPETLFHAALMAALAGFPAVVFLPARGEPFLALARRIDEQTAFESWLGYGGGPAEGLLKKRAEELLRLRSVYRPERLRASWRLLAVVAAAAACFIAAQSLSVARGYGFSLGWADKDAAERAAARAVATGKGEAERNVLVERAPEPEGAREAGQGYRPETGREGRASAGAEPSVAGARGDQARRPGNEPGEEDLSRAASSGAASADQSAGIPMGVSPAGDGDTEERSGGTAATAPGYEGSGEALESSPLVDYRASFERAFVERTGRESALGSARSELTLEGAIAEYYASFDAVVAVDGALEPALEALKRGWASALAGTVRP